MNPAASYVPPELKVYFGTWPLWLKIGWCLAMLLATAAIWMLRRYK